MPNYLTFANRILHYDRLFLFFETTVINGYRSMWIIVMFDLPTDTKEARREYGKFRKALLEDGFTMTQFSVYSRFTMSREDAEKHIRRVQTWLPPDGEVRILCCTDKQFAKMHVFFGKIRKKEPSPWQQLTFF